MIVGRPSSLSNNIQIERLSRGKRDASRGILWLQLYPSVTVFHYHIPFVSLGSHIISLFEGNLGFTSYTTSITSKKDIDRISIMYFLTSLIVFQSYVF